ncbi:GIP [Symbiodinium sp. CCMP2592]|nr:GIP [Symbiodinium sp. CCMP2592]
MAAAGSAGDSAASGETALGGTVLPKVWPVDDHVAFIGDETQITTKPKNREETEDEKQRRANGMKIKEDLKKKTPEEKKAFYVEQKVNRQAEDQKKKRTFSSAVGSVEESRDVAATNYIPFKKWAQQEMSLKVYNTLPEARVGWDKHVADPATVSIVEKGETLVLDYGGVEVRGRQAHSLKSALRQRMDISEQKDLDETRGGSADAGNCHRGGPEAGKGGEKAEDRGRLPLEKLALQASRKKAIQTMGDVALRNQATIAALSAESQKLCEFENQDLEDDMKEKMGHVDRALQVLSEEIAKYDSQWEKKEEEGTTTADEMAELRGEIAVVLKGFHSNNDAARNVKNKIQDVRIWIAKTKKSINSERKQRPKQPLELRGESSFGSVDYSLNTKQRWIVGGEWVELLLPGDIQESSRQKAEVKDQLIRQYPETGDSEGDAMTGFPAEMQAATLADVPKKLKKMNAKDLAHPVKSKGCLGETVHSLRMLVARESLAGPMKAFLEKMQSEGNIQDGDSYFKMPAWLRHRWDSCGDAHDPASVPQLWRRQCPGDPASVPLLCTVHWCIQHRWDCCGYALIGQHGQGTEESTTGMHSNMLCSMASEQPSESPIFPSLIDVSDGEEALGETREEVLPLASRGDMLKTSKKLQAGDKDLEIYCLEQELEAVKEENVKLKLTTKTQQDSISVLSQKIHQLESSRSQGERWFGDNEQFTYVTKRGVEGIANQKSLQCQSFDGIWVGAPDPGSRANTIFQDAPTVQDRRLALLEYAERVPGRLVSKMQVLLAHTGGAIRNVAKKGDPASAVAVSYFLKALDVFLAEGQWFRAQHLELIPREGEDIWIWTGKLQEELVFKDLQLNQRESDHSKNVMTFPLAQYSKWGRVSRRIEGMILAAAPSAVRQEVSAARISGLLNVVCRLYCIYGPGGLAERELGLRSIQDPPTASTTQEAIDHLRRWRRRCQRMSELGPYIDIGLGNQTTGSRQDALRAVMAQPSPTPTVEALDEIIAKHDGDTRLLEVEDSSDSPEDIYRFEETVGFAWKGQPQVDWEQTFTTMQPSLWEDEWEPGVAFEDQGIFPSDSPDSQAYAPDVPIDIQRSLYESYQEGSYVGSDGRYRDPLEDQGIFPSDSPSQVVHNVSPSDVKGNIQEWKSAVMDEVRALEEMKAIRRVKGKEAVELDLQAWITDVKNAFLLALIPPEEGAHILLRPPKVLEEMGITSPDELWEVTRAIYGLRQSPRWWSMHRDKVLSQAVWNGPHGTTRLRQSTVESNLWSMVTDDGVTVGYMIIYVDDLMLLAKPEDASGLFDWIKGRWECTPLQKATTEEPITFLGVEIQEETTAEGRTGFCLRQSGYIDELTRIYGTPSVTRSAPLPKDWVKELPEPDTPLCPHVLRKAQKITGELLWIAQRSRPDIAHEVGLMSSWVSRAPTLVHKFGLRILEFLKATREVSLSMTPISGSSAGIVVYMDASFAPFGGHSISGILVQYRGRNILWKAKRQSIVCLSTAEAELVSACEGVVLGSSTEALMKELVRDLDKMQLLVDNIAAIVISEGGGSGRTRHLRVRSCFIKDLIDKGELAVTHCPGDVQLADILTKVLAGPRHQFLRDLLGLGPNNPDVTIAAVQRREVNPVRASPERTKLWIWILVAWLQVMVSVGADADDSDGQAPLGPELSMMVLLLTFSILFVWESGKACLNACCSRREQARVAVLRAEADEQQERRQRRQEAVRRAIASETEGLRLRRDEGSDIPSPPERPYVHIQVEAPRPPPPPVVRQPDRLDLASQSTVDLQGESQSSHTTGIPHTTVEPPPPVPVRGLVEDQPARREVAVQTVESRGLTFGELQELEVLTSTSRTPGVVHLFPGCHALRGVNTNRRQFCRYCLQSARSGI